ncbi:DoxX family protein [Peribacillus simplex]|uniref:DoxX family protein n=1 Tax=Peribacillus simplex TaxID=1478 RepID=A0AAW7IUC6_9BACI|nr:DoxX family protein [Peribacillus simplex]MDM5455396.1 DoxX family protein [Peribacillus simplex]
MVIITLSIVLQLLLSFVFLMTGFGKILGTKMQVESFEHLKFKKEFRVVTGLAQIVGVIGLIIGIWYPGVASLSGIWIGIIMIGAAAAHIRVKDPFSKAVPAVVLCIVAFFIMLLNISELTKLF